MNFLHYRYIVWVWISFIPAAAFLFWSARKRATLKRSFIKEGKIKTFLFSFPTVAISLSLPVLFFTLAGPTWGIEKEKIFTTGADVIFIVDTSYSMLAEDVTPTREKAAVFLAVSILKELPGSRAGLIAFAGSSFPACPLTSDLSLVKSLLLKLNPDIVSRQGTNFKSPLETLSRIIVNRNPNRRLSVIFLSDGENFIPFDYATISNLSNKPFQFISVGIGTKKGITLKDPRAHYRSWIRDKDGNLVFSKLNEFSLSKLASYFNGSYLKFETVGITTKHLVNNYLKPTSYATFTFLSHKKKRAWFGALVLLLLLLFAYPLNVKNKVNLSTKLIILPTFLFLILSSCSMDVSDINKAKSFVKKGKFREASEVYLNLIKKLSPEDPHFSPLSCDLVGCASLYGANTQAIKYGKSLLIHCSSDMWKSILNYNIGCAYLGVNAKYKAIQYFRTALELNPNDNFARWNLELLNRDQGKRIQKPKKKKKENSVEQYLNALKDQEKSFIPKEKHLPIKVGGPYW